MSSFMLQPTRRSKHTTVRLLALATLLLSLFSIKGVAQAAPATAPSFSRDVPSCVNHRKVRHWRENKLDNEGFLPVENGTGELTFVDGVLGLYLNPTTSTALSTARVQDYLHPDIDMTRCWEPTSKKDVVVEFSQRYTTPAMTGVTQNNLLWSAPPRTAQGQTYSAFGITRNSAFGPARTYIIIAEDLTFPTFQFTYFQIVPLAVAAPWLNELDWFDVRIVVGLDKAKIQVSQGGRTATVSATLPKPVTPLGMEFSSDNELVPGVTMPIAARTGVEIGPAEMEYQRSR